MSGKDDKYYERRRASDMIKEGKTVKYVAKALHKSTSFVKKWTRRDREKKGFHDAPRAGAPQKIKPVMNPLLRSTIKKIKGGGPKQVSKQIKAKHRVYISPKTVKRAAKKMGMKFLIRPKKPRLVKTDVTDRLRFANKRRPKNFWRKVWWTDEKAFVLHMDPRGQWVECREQLKPRETDLVEKTVSVWAGISWYGKTKIFKIKPQWNSTDYENHLKKKAIPDISEMSTDGYVFEQDGAGAHRAKTVFEFFRKDSIPILDDLPSHSPDIPPIENMWKLVGDGLRQRNFRTLDGLWIAIREEWENISSENVMNLVKSLPNRLKAIKENNGKITKY